jgi:hypothetical protein
VPVFRSQPLTAEQEMELQLMHEQWQMELDQEEVNRILESE